MVTINDYIEAYQELEHDKNKTAFFIGKGKVKEKLNKAKEKIKGFIKNVGAFGVLIPFKSLLANALNRKGVKHDGTIEDIAVKFYNTFINKKSNYEQYNHLDPVIVSTIIGAILSFIRAAKEKKKQGGQLSDTEEFIVNGADKISSVALGAAKEEASLKIGNFLLSPVGIIAIVAILFMLLKK